MNEKILIGIDTEIRSGNKYVQISDLYYVHVSSVWDKEKLAYLNIFMS